jgi:hypothetical protein
MSGVVLVRRGKSKIHENYCQLWCTVRRDRVGWVVSVSVGESTVFALRICRN